MKYLIHLSLPEQFSRFTDVHLKQIQDDIADTSSLGYHSTLMVLRMNPEQEHELVNALSSIKPPAFPCVLEEKLELFDGNTLVARLQQNPSLTKLHHSIIERGREFIDWDETAPLSSQYKSDAERQAVYTLYGTPYYGPFFNPHVSLCSSKPGAVLILSQMDALGGYTWVVDCFSLFKKGESWKRVQDFKLHP